METVIQKMIELGAYEIVPVSTKRCIVKLDNKKAVSKTNVGIQLLKVRLSSLSEELFQKFQCL